MGGDYLCEKKSKILIDCLEYRAIGNTYNSSKITPKLILSEYSCVNRTDNAKCDFTIYIHTYTQNTVRADSWDLFSPLYQVHDMTSSLIHCYIIGHIKKTRHSLHGNIVMIFPCFLIMYSITLPDRQMDIGNAEIMMTEALVYILYISSMNRTYSSKAYDSPREIQA